MCWTNIGIDLLIISSVMGYDLQLIHAFNEGLINARDQCLWHVTRRNTAFELEDWDSEYHNARKSCIVINTMKKVLCTLCSRSFFHPPNWTLYFLWSIEFKLHSFAKLCSEAGCFFSTFVLFKNRLWIALTFVTFSSQNQLRRNSNYLCTWGF